jgi:hypothetical protein
MNNIEKVLLVVAALVVGLAGDSVSNHLLPQQEFQQETVFMKKEIFLLDKQGDLCAIILVSV